DRLLVRHEPVPAVFLDLVGHRRREIVCDRALDRLVAEAPDAVELRLVEPIEQLLKVCVGLAGKAHDEGRAYRELRTDIAPTPDPGEGFLLRRRPFHSFEHVWA